MLARAVCGWRAALFAWLTLTRPSVKSISLRGGSGGRLDRSRRSRRPRHPAGLACPQGPACIVRTGLATILARAEAPLSTDLVFVADPAIRTHYSGEKSHWAKTGKFQRALTRDSAHWAASSCAVAETPCPAAGTT